MTRRFYTSDQHIEHELVSVERMLRLLNSNNKASGTFDGEIRKEDLSPDQIADLVAEHSAVQAENWDRVVRPDDTVVVLGDIAMNPKKGAFEWFRNRPGKKHLIAGNHDAVHPMHSKALQAQQDPAWLEVFATINPWLRLKMMGRTVLLSHFPYDGEGSRDIEDRNVEYRLKDEGFPLLHGHTHHTHRAHVSKQGSPQLHVGLDAWDLQLVPESTVLEWLEFLPLVKSSR